MPTIAAMLFITHDFSVLAHATQYCYVLDHGTIVEQGRTAAGQLMRVPPDQGLVEPHFAHHRQHARLAVFGGQVVVLLWPGLLVTIVVVALNLFGDALRDASDPLINPRLRGA